MGEGRAVDGGIREVDKDAEGVDGGGLRMPGILQRSESTVKGQGATKILPDAHSGAVIASDTRNVEMKDYRNGDALTNGGLALVNGSHANDTPPIPTDVQQKTFGMIEKLVGQLPPEIEHITFGYVPLSLLIGRLVQETFNGLADVINDMSDLPVSQSGQDMVQYHHSAQVNGNVDRLQANVQKKLRMLHFANERRAQFIKILILSRWGRQAEAMSRVIDLNVWLSTQKQQFVDCCSWLGELKRRLVPVKDPNPDINTALKVLSLGKALWLPDLGYLQPEVLSPHQLRDALRKINTLLSIRLNLHEAIPPVLRSFSIASGRATFRIPKEFEVDLSIADQNPSSQLYLVDFRFTFQPTPAELPAGRFRDEIEGRANNVLKREGLQGLFDFLHNVALTHKLIVLRNQAYELERGYMSEHLKTESLHRSVVVQYWLNRPGGKNWIEIGLKRGKEKKVSFSSDSHKMSHLTLRWFRSGQEMSDVHVNMGLDVLSLADILKQVITLHTNYTFQDIAAKLSEGTLYSDCSLRIKHESLTTESTTPSLLIQLTATKAVKIVQEPVSGRFVFLPSSLVNSRAEYEFNRISYPGSESASQLSHFRSLASQEEVDSSARSLGWELLRSLNPSLETMRYLFPGNTHRAKFFRRRGWSPYWTLAFTTSIKGDAWWIVELVDRGMPEAGKPKTAVEPLLRAAYRIPMIEQPSLVVEPSRVKLAEVERKAVGMIAQYNDARYMAASGSPHDIRPSTANRILNQKIITTFIQSPGKNALARSHPASRTVPWFNEIVKLDYLGLDSSYTCAVHVASARMQKPISDIKELTSTIPCVAFHPTSTAFSFRLLTKIGETTIPNLVHRLSAIGRLLEFISIVKSHNIRLNTASLNHLDLTYTKAPSYLRAAIHFAAETPMQMSLMQPNPHLRIIDHLTTRLLTQGLTSVISVMHITLPLLRALSAMELAHTTGGVDILIRSEQWYHVRYSSPNPQAGFDIRLRQRRDDSMWLIPDASIKRLDAASEVFEQALKTVMRSKGQGWRGMNGGVVATFTGIEEIVGRLDEVFRTRSQHVAQESNVLKRKAEDEVVEID